MSPYDVSFCSEKSWIRYHIEGKYMQCIKMNTSILIRRSLLRFRLHPFPLTRTQEYLRAFASYHEKQHYVVVLAFFRPSAAAASR